MFKRYTKYVASGNITGVCVGRGFNMEEKTPLFGTGVVSYLDEKLYKWKSNVSDANYLENIRRRLIAQKVLNACKWPSSDLEFELKPVVDRADLLFDKNDRPYVNDLLKIKNLDIDSEFLPVTEPENLDIELTFTGNKSVDYPIVNIQINQHYYNNILHLKNYLYHISMLFVMQFQIIYRCLLEK
jgi:hypothetical protein